LCSFYTSHALLPHLLLFPSWHILHQNFSHSERGWIALDRWIMLE
jgi:hypothetical protein